MNKMKRCSICEKPLAPHNKSGLCHYHLLLKNGSEWREQNKEYIRMKARESYTKRKEQNEN